MFNLKWILANGVAYALGVPAVMLAIDVLGRLLQRLFHLVQDPTFNQATILFLWIGIIVAGLLLGVFVASIQWIVLRSVYKSDKSWIVITIAAHAIGLPIALSLGFPFVYIGNGPVAFLIMGGLMAAITGFFQWRILHKIFSRAEIWIAASSIGLGLGMAGGYYLTENMFIFTEVEVNPLIALGAVSGMSYGLITSAALALILRRKCC